MRLLVRHAVLNVLGEEESETRLTSAVCSIIQNLKYHLTSVAVGRAQFLSIADAKHEKRNDLTRS